MCHKTVRLGALVDIMTGVPMSRAKKIAGDDDPVKVNVLIPGAMSSGRINDSLIATEEVSKVKEELFLREGDVVVKASTPYDCVFVDKRHEGLLSTSFGLILRARTQDAVDMRYLAAYLGLESINKELQSMSKGMSIKLIKKRDLEGLMVPVPTLEEQARLGSLYESTQGFKELCRTISEKSSVLLQSEFYRTVLDND